MKRGRKKLSVEKDGKYDLARLFHGRNPQASSFANEITQWASQTGLRRSEALESIGATLADVGQRDDEHVARFFDDVAAFFRIRHTLPMGIFDAPRFILASILMIECRGKPINYTELAQMVTSETGLAVSERWVREEAVRLGYPRPRRGRPRK